MSDPAERLAELTQEAFEILADSGIPPLQASKLAAMIELIARLVVQDVIAPAPEQAYTLRPFDVREHMWDLDDDANTRATEAELDLSFADDLEGQ